MPVKNNPLAPFIKGDFFCPPLAGVQGVDIPLKKGG